MSGTSGACVEHALDAASRTVVVRSARRLSATSSASTFVASLTTSLPGSSRARRPWLRPASAATVPSGAIGDSSRSSYSPGRSDERAARARRRARPGGTAGSARSAREDVARGEPRGAAAVDLEQERLEVVGAAAPSGPRRGRARRTRARSGRRSGPPRAEATTLPAMFHDRARIHVQAGRGSDGALSFRREKFVPKGGPDGGDGGDGGDVVLLAEPDLRDLSRFRPNQRVRAARGGNGSGGNRHGARGEDIELDVPVGTQVFDEDGQLIADLARPRTRPGGAGRHGRPRQPPLRLADAPDAALRRDGAPGRGGHDRAAPEAARRRRARRSAERGQVVAAAPDLEREAEGGRLPVHDGRAGARHCRLAGRAAADGRRRAGPDRGSERGRRARPRVPRAPRARASAAARDRRVGRSRGRVPDDRPRARAVRRRSRRAAAGGRVEQDRPAPRATLLRPRRRACAPRLPGLVRDRRGHRRAQAHAVRAVPARGSRRLRSRREPRDWPSSSSTGRGPSARGRTASSAPTAAFASPERRLPARSSRPRCAPPARAGGARSRSATRRWCSSDRPLRRRVQPTAPGPPRARAAPGWRSSSSSGSTCSSAVIPRTSGSSAPSTSGSRSRGSPSPSSTAPRCRPTRTGYTIDRLRAEPPEGEAIFLDGRRPVPRLPHVEGARGDPRARSARCRDAGGRRALRRFGRGTWGAWCSSRSTHPPIARATCASGRVAASRSTASFRPRSPRRSPGEGSIGVPRYTDADRRGDLTD